MKQVPWPNAVVMVAIVAGVVLLVAMGRDSAALLGLAGLILAAIGAVGGMVTGVRDNTNGNISKLIAAVESLGHRLGDAPAIPRPDAAVVTDSHTETAPLDTEPTRPLA